MVKGGTLQFTAYGVYSDGSTSQLPDAQGDAVTAWSSSNAQVGSVTSTGLATALAAGTTNIQATIGTLKASVWGLTITAPSAEKATLVSAYLGTPANPNTVVKGGTLQFTAYGVYSDGSTATLPDTQGDAVSTWSSTNPQAISVSSTGLATALAAGTTSIQATIGALKASPYSLTVTAPSVAKTTLVSAYLGTPASANTMVKGGTLQFTAYGVYSDGSTATLPDTQGNAVTAWSSSNAQVGSVTSAGLATALAAGTTNIQATIGALKASIWTLTITAPPAAKTTLVSAYLGTPASANTMVKGGTLQFTAFGVYSDGSTATLPDTQGNAVTAWSSSNAQVGSVSTTGLAKALAAGTTNIQATIGALKASIWTLTITAPPAAKTSLVSAYLGTPASANTMVKGGTLQFTAFGVYSDGSTAILPDTQGVRVTAWSSSNARVVSVSSTGMARALAAGTTNIQATIGALKASIWTLTVTGPASPAAAAPTLQSVMITPSQAVVSIGSTTQLKATATFSDDSVKDVTSEFAWQSSDPRTIATNAAGILSGLASGPAAIAGSYQGVQASASATSSVGELDWSSPIVITEAGTYSGNWQSTDPGTPAVTVATTAPVVIENSHIRSVGNLIKTTVPGSDLTVRNSLGVAANASVKGQPNGIFLDVQSPIKLDVENNYIENARGGVIVHGYAGNRDGEQTIVIRSNRARNLNGLLSDGQGGYLPGEGANHTTAQFIQLDSVRSVPGIDVGWNEVINYPGHSLVQDNIDLYRSGGTPNRPLEIHDTYIQGAYPYNPAQDAYTGGGIKTNAKAGDTAQEVPAFNNIHDNQVVGTVSYGIEFGAGHDNVASNNRVVSSGLLANGARIPAQNAGLANANPPGAADYNNTMRDNLIGWTCWKASCASEGFRRDQYFPASPADYSTNSVLPAGQITLNLENNEYLIWTNKMAISGVTVGPSF
jgi:hypothetical protein